MYACIMHACTLIECSLDILLAEGTFMGDVIARHNDVMYDGSIDGWIERKLTTCNYWQNVHPATFLCSSRPWIRQKGWHVFVRSKID
jgi:hypothetical protein